MWPDDTVLPSGRARRRLERTNLERRRSSLRGLDQLLQEILALLCHARLDVDGQVVVKPGLTRDGYPARLPRFDLQHLESAPALFDPTPDVAEVSKELEEKVRAKWGELF